MASKYYMIVPVVDLESIDYNVLNDTSVDTTRINIHGTHAVVEWNGDVYSTDVMDENAMNTYLQDNYLDWNEITTP